jgi:hypothetical protein
LFIAAGPVTIDSGGATTENNVPTHCILKQKKVAEGVKDE